MAQSAPPTICNSSNNITPTREYYKQYYALNNQRLWYNDEVLLAIVDVKLYIQIYLLL